MELVTQRLIMRTNIQFDNGHLVIPDKKSGIIDILNICPGISEDGGFIFYDNSGNRVCHIGIRTDRKPCEISYGTQEQYRGNGYMQEALSFLLKLFSENNIVEVCALICNNPVSEHILLKNGFVKKEHYEYGGDWFALP